MIHYLLNHDVKFILQEKTKQIIGYFAVLLIASLYFFFMLKNDHMLNYLNTLGLDFNPDKNIIITIIFFIHLATVVYLEIYLFSKDIKHGASSFLLRTNIKNWLVARIISIMVMTIFLKVIIHIVFLIFSMIFYGRALEFYNIINYFTLDILYFMIVQSVALLFYLIYSLSGKILLVGCFFIIMFINKIPLNIISLDNCKIYMLIALLLLQVIDYYLLKLSYIKIFEKEIV